MPPGIGKEQIEGRTAKLFRHISIVSLYSTSIFKLLFQNSKFVTEETAVAQAEAKYNREKQKINAKENVIDMKMKNLDTEISALTTEYDTVKSVIDKNIEKLLNGITLNKKAG